VADSPKIGDLVQPMPPNTENIRMTTRITAGVRPSPRPWSTLTTGFSKKVSKRANATGMKTVWAQYNAAMIRARLVSS
jgi:hypothetical protein